MAITAYGTSPSMGETEWAQFQDILGRGGWNEVVSASTHFAVTAASGTRLVSVSAGEMAACGILVKNSAAVSVALASNATGLARIDAIVLRIDWTGDVSDAATIVAKTGTAAASPVAPSLSRTPGTLYEVLLANVAVASGAGQLVAANVTKRTPQQRVPTVTRIQPDATTVTGSGTPEVARITGDDPGWPYRLDVRASMNFGLVTAGRGEIISQVDGVDLAGGIAGLENSAPAVLRPAITEARTGPWVARLQIARGSSMNQDLVLQPSLSNFTVIRIPS